MADRYRGAGTLGGKMGCGAAALIGGPLFFVLMLVDSLGDCVPNTSCHKSFVTGVVFPTLLIALPIWLLVRVLVNRFWR